MTLPAIKTEQEKQGIIHALHGMRDNYQDIHNPLFGENQELGTAEYCANEEDILLIIADLEQAKTFPINLSLHTTAEDQFIIAYEQYHEDPTLWEEDKSA
jgi:hypothetical protein|tara:strand:+ start:389 stop:688 length:300 start_codon:yes stop_codon:yes gene_type:complete